MTSRLSLELRHIWSKVSGQRARAQGLAKDAFHAALARLGPGDICVDLGANKGEFTVPMAETGAQVYAFEPDPHALTLLTQATQAHPNVTIIAAAAGTEEGTATLYRKTSFQREPDRATKSSSLYGEKRNVRAEDAVSVPIRDLPAFLTGLDQDIALMKIDIEGAEVALMEVLLDAPVAGRIGEIYIETHERALPDLADRTARLRARTKATTAPRVNWDWH